MLTAERDELWTDRRRSRWMRARAPVNEEWNDAVGQHDSRVGQRPRERHAIQALAAALADRTEAHAAPCGIDDNARQIGRRNGPRDHSRRRQPIDAEPSRHIERRLI